MGSNSKKDIDVALKRKAVSLLDAIASGADEQTACDRNGVNRGQFVKWVIQYPEFEKAVENAKKLRADIYKSKITQLAMYADGEIKDHDKDDVPGIKANFEMLKWLASVDNPDKYGTKTKVENVGQPTQIIIDTGIKPNKPDIEVESEDELL